jgi:hypothetical protein
VPVKVKCTSCSEEMMLPDGAAGKQFSCPRCRAKFSVSGNSASVTSSVSMKAQPTPPPAPSAGRVTGSYSDEELAKYLEEQNGEAAASPRGGSTSLTQPTKSSVAVPVSAPPDPTTQSTSARFIIADATARRMELGASGQLPSLVLDEAKKKEPEERPEGSKPWLLLAVVLGSVLLSVAMLFFDTAALVGEPSGKGRARKLVEERYVQLSPARPCQPLLARAIQAYNRGDSAEERRLYRRVLDMLHSEGKDPNEGVTGAIQSDSLPNDKELEELISTLLRE